MTHRKLYLCGSQGPSRVNKLLRAHKRCFLEVESGRIRSRLGPGTAKLKWIRSGFARMAEDLLFGERSVTNKWERKVYHVKIDLSKSDE